MFLEVKSKARIADQDSSNVKQKAVDLEILCEILKGNVIGKKMIKTNQDGIDGQYLKHGNGMLGVTDEENSLKNLS